jgi:Domain of unknown function (DUF4190)
MYPSDDPFAPQSGDPFAGPPPTVSYGGGPTSPVGYPAHPGAPFGGPPPSADYNTLAVLSPIFGVLVPPAGIVMGHLALPQINRSGERGRPAAIAGLVIGYLMCVLLILGGVYWGTRPSSSTPVNASNSVVPMPPPPRTITSVAPPTTVPRGPKLDLATVPLGTCVELQLRNSSGNDALDLFGVDCEHREGVYTVAARVRSANQCNSVYVTSPPDRSFALCLNPY